jgi:hypothetical protein
MRRVRLTLHVTSDQGGDELYDVDVDELLDVVGERGGTVERVWQLPGGLELRLKCAPRDTP